MQNSNFVADLSVRNGRKKSLKKNFGNSLNACLAFALAICLVMITGCNNSQTPESITKHAVPEPETAGAKVFTSFCGDCHAPPRIQSHKADEWRNVVNRMQNHRLKKAYKLLTDEEKETLITYLQKHSVTNQSAQEPLAQKPLVSKE